MEVGWSGSGRAGWEPDFDLVLRGLGGFVDYSELDLACFAAAAIDC
jgi:hypothetical protein